MQENHHFLGASNKGGTLTGSLEKAPN